MSKCHLPSVIPDAGACGGDPGSSARVVAGTAVLLQVPMCLRHSSCWVPALHSPRNESEGRLAGMTGMGDRPRGIAARALEGKRTRERGGSGPSLWFEIGCGLRRPTQALGLSAAIPRTASQSGASLRFSPQRQDGPGVELMAPRRKCRPDPRKSASARLRPWPLERADAV